MLLHFFFFAFAGKAVPKNSLNFSLRRDRMERIISDNLVLLNRINDQKPHYKTKKFLKGYRDNDKKYRQLYSRNATAGHLRANSTLPALDATRVGLGLGIGLALLYSLG